MGHAHHAQINSRTEENLGTVSILPTHTTHRYCLVIKISRAISNLLTYTTHRFGRVFFRYQVNMYTNLTQNWFSILGLLIHISILFHFLMLCLKCPRTPRTDKLKNWRKFRHCVYFAHTHHAQMLMGYEIWRTISNLSTHRFCGNCFHIPSKNVH